MPPRRRLRESNPVRYGQENSSSASGEHDAWLLDQLTKSEYFHRKLHEWGMLEVARQIEAIKGETLEWDIAELGISQAAWDKAIHRGIKPIIVFAHPHVIASVSRALSYYRMLAMVSQKSMSRIGLASARYEETTTLPDPSLAALFVSRLNHLISRLIEKDQEIDTREFDMWRGMTAGSQAQGSWQNAKGDAIETQVKDVLRQRLWDRQLVAAEEDEFRLSLRDGRTVVFGDEPDFGVYLGEFIVSAVEIKGGIDVAGVLERVGAAMKSLSRAKESNPTAVTILILPAVSLTPQAVGDLKTNQSTVNHWMTVEDVLQNDKARSRLFELLGL